MRHTTPPGSADRPGDPFAAAVTAVLVAVCAIEAAAILALLVARPPTVEPAAAPGLPPAAAAPADGVEPTGPAHAAFAVVSGGDLLMPACWAGHHPVDATC